MDNQSPKESNPDPSLEDICSDLDKVSLINQLEEEAEDPKQLEEDSYFSCESSVADNSDDESNVVFTTALSAPAQMEGEYMIAVYHVKLYRFEVEEKQWKEKGVGEIHILKSMIQKNECRVVMWVDGTGRVACNFRLFPEITVNADERNPKTACWRCFDFSDVDLPKWETFACKFPSEEQCNDFMGKIQSALDATPPPLIASEEQTGVSNCQGCIGCDPDTFEFPQEVKMFGKLEHIIDCRLGSDSCTDDPISVEPTMFK